MPHQLTDIEFDSLEFVSLVDEGASGDADHRPAIVLVKRKGQAARKGDQAVDLRASIVKIDKAQQVVTGWASVVTRDDGEPIVDYDGDVILASDLEKAVHNASALGGASKGGDMHLFQGAGDIVESLVLTNEKRAAFKGALGEPGREGWVISMKVRDKDSWQSVLDGKRPELSVKIRAKRTPIKTDSVVKRIAQFVGLSPKPKVAKQMAEDTAVEGAAPDPNKAALAAAFDETLASLTDAQQKVILAFIETARGEMPPDPTALPEGEDEGDEPVTEAEKVLKADIKKVRDEKVALEKRVAAMEDAAELKVCIEKARAEMPNVIGMKHDELGAILKRAKSTFDDADYERLEKSFRAMSKAVELGELFAEHGSGGEAKPDSVEGEVQVAVEKMLDKDPAMSRAKARDDVLNANPKLYERLVKEAQKAVS